MVSELVPVGTSAFEGINPTIGAYHIVISLRDVYLIGIQIWYTCGTVMSSDLLYIYTNLIKLVQINCKTTKKRGQYVSYRMGKGTSMHQVWEGMDTAERC